MRIVIRIAIRKMRKIRKLRATLLNIRLLMTEPLLNTMLRLVIVSPRLLSIR